MKNIRFLTFVLTIATVLLSACGAAATQATPVPSTTIGSSKVNAMPVAFVGVVDSITGDQWVISGTKVTVDQSIVRDGPFSVGDRIKVEGFVNPDGSLTVSRVETPIPQDAATQSVADNSNDAIDNANTNDANVNDDNSSAINSNDASANVNDDHGTDVNTNDDHGSNVNASNDNSSTANSNDDKGGSGGSNSNDDKGGSGGGGNSNDDNGNGG